jgi:hypothetical protein
MIITGMVDIVSITKLPRLARLRCSPLLVPIFGTETSRQRLAFGSAPGIRGQSSPALRPGLEVSTLAGSSVRS